MFDAVILSDLHLGGANSQAKALCAFLEDISEGAIATERLILNGDVFQSFDFRRLNKSHWKVLSLIRKLSDRVETIWLCGNHDGSAEVVSHLLGVTVMNEYSLKTGERRILVLHGHVFDDFLDAHPILTWLGDCVYAFLQWLDRSHAIARLAKHGSKTFLRCARKVEERSTAYARARGYDAVCCGHTHLAQAAQANGVEYFNSGCWTEVPCTYLTVADGCVELQQFEPTFTEYSAQDSDAAYAV